MALKDPKRRPTEKKKRICDERRRRVTANKFLRLLEFPTFEREIERRRKEDAAFKLHP